MKIAFFDSGIGGLSVLREAVKVIPNEKYIYYADSLNAPYGTKTKEEVQKLVFDAIDHLDMDMIKVLVVACNTATSIAIDQLRERLAIPVIGMEPAVKVAVEKNSSKKVLVLATPLTLREMKFNMLLKKLDSEDKVDIIPLQKLVEFAENYIFNDKIVYDYLKERFSLLELDTYSSIVLGCTHFSFFKEQIREITKGSLDIIDGNKGTVKQLSKVLNGINDKGDGFLFEGYISGKKIVDIKLLEKYMDIIRGTSV